MNYQSKPNYRIYALVIGEVLTPGKIFDCEIKKISFEEQKKRLFSPIQSVFSEDDITEYYKTYASSLPYIDPVLIKSEYVIIYDIRELDVNAALGGATRYFDKICRFLTFAYGKDFMSHTQRNSMLEPYLYQVNKIYSLDTGGNESNLEFKLESGNMYLPNRPELNKWRDKDTQQFLEDVFNFHDDVLERAIKYLYRSSIGNFVKDSPEKIVLDHFKSMEIIINSLSNKKDFKARVDEVAKIINLTDKEKEKIKKLWDDRSKYSDTAHPSKFDQTERYPNQFPLPSNVTFSYPHNDSISVDVCLKYFLYKKNSFIIDIDEPHFDKVESFGEINSQWDSNHLYFETFEKNKERLKKKIKENSIKFFNIKESDIAEIILGKGKKTAILRNKY